MKQNNNHTPGPWEYAEIDSANQYRWIRTTERDPIAFTQRSGYLEKEADANARLIAAAPDMKDELDITIFSMHAICELISDQEAQNLPRRTSGEITKIACHVIESHARVIAKAATRK